MLVKVSLDWSILLSALALAVGVLGLILALRDRFRQITCSVGEPQAFPDLKAFDKPLALGGKVLTDPYLMVLHISNTGWQAIEAKDAVRPIRVRTTAASIHTASISSPHNDASGSTSSENHIDVWPGLLNRKDRLTITLLCDGRPEQCDVTGHITGIKRIRRAADPGQRESSLRLEVGLFVASVAFLVSIYFAIVWSFERGLGAAANSLSRQLENDPAIFLGEFYAEIIEGFMGSASSGFVLGFFTAPILLIVWLLFDVLVLLFQRLKRYGAQLFGMDEV